jgi:phosphohistidine phosphatase
MPTLVLLRHAKAEPMRPDDHSRGLAARGRADATAVRAWLEQRGIHPDRVVASTSQRTRETWELAGPGGPEAVYDARIYEASTEALREVIGETPEDVQTLVLVGHNPSVERLAWELDDGAAARERTDPGLPTSALAIFAVPGWTDLTGAVLQEVAVPRG